MNTATNDPAHPFHATMTEICKGTIATVADLPGDSPARRALRQQTVADTMVSFQPHNPLETILAGQCVVFDHLVHEAARELLRGQAELLKLRARPQICASAKIFLAGLEKFEQLQARSAASLASEHTSEATGHTSEATGHTSEATGHTSEATAEATGHTAEATDAEAVTETLVATGQDQRRQDAPLAARSRAATNHAAPAPSHTASTQVPEAAGPVHPHAGNPSDQPGSPRPYAAERELAHLLARHGQTAASVDELIESHREPLLADDLALADAEA